MRGSNQQIVRQMVQDEYDRSLSYYRAARARGDSEAAAHWLAQFRVARLMLRDFDTEGTCSTRQSVSR